MHQQGHLQRILGPPRLWPESQQAELQAPAPLVAADEGVHPLGVGLQGPTIGFRHPLEGLLRDLPEAVGPMQAVELQRPRPDHFGQAAVRVAAHEFHLEEALPGHREALQPEGIGQIAGPHRRQAPRVERDGAFRRQARYRRGRVIRKLAPNLDPGSRHEQRESHPEACQDSSRPAHAGSCFPRIYPERRTRCGFQSTRRILWA